MKARKIACASAALVSTALAMACTTQNTQCECIQPGARIHVAQESAAAVTQVRLSGAACNGLTATCVQTAAVGCATYSFSPTTPGACTVDVIFADGAFTANITFTQTSGCCAGIYPSPASAGDIEATRGPSDAGSAG